MLDKVRNFDIDAIKARFLAIAANPYNLSADDLSTAMNKEATKVFANIQPKEKRKAFFKYKEIWDNSSILEMQILNLHNADLSGANLSVADLSYVNLFSANLNNTNLRNSNLHYAIFVYTDFTNAQNLDNTKGRPFCTIGCPGSTARQKCGINSVGELIAAIGREMEDDDIKSEHQCAAIRNFAKVAGLIIEHNNELKSNGKPLLETPEELKLLANAHAKLVKYPYLSKKAAIDRAAKETLKNNGGLILATLGQASRGDKSAAVTSINHMPNEVLRNIATFLIASNLPQVFKLALFNAFPFNKDAYAQSAPKVNLIKAFSNQFERNTSLVKAIEAKKATENVIVARR